MSQAKLRDVIVKFEGEILDEWIKEQLAELATGRDDRISEAHLRDQCREFLGLLREGLEQVGTSTDTTLPSWSKAREFLSGVSRSRALQGFTPSETALFVLSIKRPVFHRLRREVQTADALADTVWLMTELLDRLALHTTEVFQKSREDVIARQQQELLELSTPVVKLWQGILALPMIGTLDSNRTQVVMESLLQKIVETESEIAIIDITGVPTVDTLVAQHLLKTVAAARLMGADCIISGIRPQIAQTMVHLAVDLGNVATKATLADAFALALRRKGVNLTARAPKAV